jgi:hypothetical protein
MAFMAMGALNAGGNAVQDVAYDVVAGRPMCHVPVDANAVETDLP